MEKPHAKSTLAEMKAYIRAKKLNTPDIRLGMKKAEMVAALKKMGHWDPKHDGASAKKSAPKKKGPVQGEDPARDKRLYEKYKKDMLAGKYGDIKSPAFLKNLDMFPEVYRNNIIVKAGRDLYKEVNKSKPDPAKDKRLYEKYVKALKKRTVKKEDIDNLKNMPDTHRNNILKKAIRDVYNQQQKKTVKPADSKLRQLKGPGSMPKPTIKSAGATKKISPKPKPAPKEPAPKPKSSFKIGKTDMSNLRFRWELWWEKNGDLGLGSYKEIPRRIVNYAFTSQEELDDKEKRESIFKKLQKLIGEGNMGDGETWKTITKRDVENVVKGPKLKPPPTIKGIKWTLVEREGDEYWRYRSSGVLKGWEWEYDINYDTSMPITTPDDGQGSDPDLYTVSEFRKVVNKASKLSGQKLREYEFSLTGI